MSKEFIKGNEAIAEAAVRAGCRFCGISDYTAK